MRFTALLLLTALAAALVCAQDTTADPAQATEDSTGSPVQSDAPEETTIAALTSAAAQETTAAADQETTAAADQETTAAAQKPTKEQEKNILESVIEKGISDLKNVIEDVKNKVEDRITYRKKQLARGIDELKKLNPLRFFP